MLSDNGPAFLSQALKEYLKQYRLQYVRGAPYHPMTQGKIERYHRSMKNVVKLQTFYFPWELRSAISEFVAYCNHERYHESLDNMTPADVYFGRVQEVKTRREEIKQATSEKRGQQHRQGVHDGLYWERDSPLFRYRKCLIDFEDIQVCDAIVEDQLGDVFPDYLESG